MMPEFPRCTITGNPCLSDTWQKGNPPDCHCGAIVRGCLPPHRALPSRPRMDVQYEDACGRPMPNRGVWCNAMGGSATQVCEDCPTPPQRPDDAKDAGSGALPRAAAELGMRAMGFEIEGALESNPKNPSEKP